MKDTYIFYKIITVPTGGHFIKYAKKISFNNVVFTRNKSQAKPVGLLPAIMYSILYGLSIGQYQHNNETTYLTPQFG